MAEVRGTGGHLGGPWKAAEAPRSSESGSPTDLGRRQKGPQTCLFVEVAIKPSWRLASLGIAKRCSSLRPKGGKPDKWPPQKHTKGLGPSRPRKARRGPFELRKWEPENAQGGRLALKEGLAWVEGIKGAVALYATGFNVCSKVHSVNEDAYYYLEVFFSNSRNFRFGLLACIWFVFIVPKFIRIFWFYRFCQGMDKPRCRRGLALGSGLGADIWLGDNVKSIF